MTQMGNSIQLENFSTLPLPGKTQEWSVTVTDQCRACGQKIEPFMSLGRQPAAQVLVHSDLTHDQFTYELKPAVCSSCCLLQLIEVPSPQLLFHESYPYFTGTSQHMTAHFKKWAESLTESLVKVRDPFLVEIGSNDGTFLQNMVRWKIRHLGVEPAKNVASVARSKGVAVMEAFFNAKTAFQIRKRHGLADVIAAANVIAHIPAINEVAAGVSILLKDEGVFTFEAIYLGDLVRSTMLDQIYDEHVFTFSVQAVRNVFGRFGLELVQVEHQPTHGGSMRYTLAHNGRRQVHHSVVEALEEEQSLGLHSRGTYEQFANRSVKIRDRFLSLLRDLRLKGKRVAGYGATAKSTTMLNYCGVDSKLIDYIVDSTPVKQGKLTPGSHIPVHSPAHFVENRPDYTVLFAWNHRKEIEQKEDVYRAGGGKWIIYVPGVAVV